MITIKEVDNKAFELMDQAIEEIKKSMISTPLVSQNTNQSFRPIKAAIDKTAELVEKNLNEAGKILKSLMDTNLSIAENNSILSKRLTKLERYPEIKVSAPSSSSTRFEKSNDGNGNLMQDENTFNVTSQEDLNRLSEKLLGEHSNLLKKGNKEQALLIEKTINSIELSNQVPEAAYRQLFAMGIKLVSPSPLRKQQDHLFKSSGEGRGFEKIFGSTRS